MGIWSNDVFGNDAALDLFEAAIRSRTCAAFEAAVRRAFAEYRETFRRFDAGETELVLDRRQVEELVNQARPEEEEAGDPFLDELDAIVRQAVEAPILLTGERETMAAVAAAYLVRCHAGGDYAHPLLNKRFPRRLRSCEVADEVLREALALQSDVIDRGRVGEFDPNAESTWFAGEV